MWTAQRAHVYKTTVTTLHAELFESADLSTQGFGAAGGQEYTQMRPEEVCAEPGKITGPPNTVRKVHFHDTQNYSKVPTSQLKIFAVVVVTTRFFGELSGHGGWVSE